MRCKLTFLVLPFVFLLGVESANAQAPNSLPAEVARWLQSVQRLQQKHEGSAICIREVPVGKLAEATAAVSSPRGDSVSPMIEQDLLLALTRRYPCPFDPRDVPVSLASSEALQGFWKLSTSSLALKTNRFKEDPFGDLRCQTLGFMRGGEMRVIEQTGTGDCLPLTLADIQGLSSFPNLKWRSSGGGDLTIRRVRQEMDEVWGAYVVSADFERKGVKFLKGDLLLYMKQFGPISGEGRGTLYFRHFQPFKP
jgi:hypothetical protein